MCLFSLTAGHRFIAPKPDVCTDDILAGTHLCMDYSDLVSITMVTELFLFTYSRKTGIV